VRCFASNGRPLKIVGGGPEYRALRRLARPNIEFCGRVSAGELRELYAHCRALLMPGEEDFGIVPVEAMASGKPVIALGRGGVLESVPLERPLGGVLYEQTGEAALEEALARFERLERLVSPQALQGWATRFSESRFQDEMRDIIGVPATEGPQAKLAMHSSAGRLAG
jgi:glycosyltransferase involved in cell wall biosynthesis